MQANEYEREIQRLFERWAQKQGDAIDGVSLERRWFIADGIVHYDTWSDLPPERRILFVLKEVNDPECNRNWTIQELLIEDYKYRMWRRLAEWARGILLTESSKPAPAFEEFPDVKDADDWLRKIAVINLKKYPGGGSADMATISRCARQDRSEILEELRLIDPAIIICGGTYGVFSEILSLPADSIRISNPTLGYHYATIFDKERLIIDFWHPANFYPMTLNYYGITGIYQHAIRAKNSMR